MVAIERNYNNTLLIERICEQQSLSELAGGLFIHPMAGSSFTSKTLSSERNVFILSFF